jgi:hypothetical protein
MKLPIKPLHKLSALVATLLVVGLVFLAVSSVSAGSATLSLAPASGTATKGRNLSVSVYVNTDEPVNAASVSLSYPEDLLGFVSVTNSPAFGIVAATSGGGGTVNIDRGALPAVNSKQLFATVTFNVKGGSGRAAINFSGNNNVVSAHTNQSILASTAGASYALVSPEENKPPAWIPDGIKLRACQNREASIKNIMARIVDRTQKQANLYSAIAERTQKFYADKDKQLAGYDELVADVNTKKDAAQAAIDELKASASQFTCDSENRRELAEAFNDNLDKTIEALQAYRQAVKNLVAGVKSVHASVLIWQRVS